MTRLQKLPDNEAMGIVHLTVIIPTRNRLQTANLLAERIRELLATLNIEIIVVAPAANGTPRPSNLVRYVTDEGRGVYRAYDAGLRSARGEYVWFIGDDDYPLDPVAHLSEVLQEGSVDLLIAPVLFSSGRIYRPTRTLLILHFLNWCQQGVIYRRRELSRYRFFHRLTVQADQYVNIMMRSDPHIIRKYLVEPICMFGVNGISGRARDAGYRSLRLALAHRTLGCGAFIAFRFLALVEPLIKRLVKLR